MSYGNNESRPRRAKGGGRLVFLIVLGVGLFFIFGGFGTQSDRGLDQTGQDTGVFDPFEGIGQNEHADSDSRGQANRGDWKMEDVPVDTSETKTSRRSQANETSSGDWSLEEIPATATKKDPIFKFSNKPTRDAPKSTEKGDWKLEEVPDKKDQ